MGCGGRVAQPGGLYLAVGKAEMPAPVTMQEVGEFKFQARQIQFERAPLALVESDRKEHVDVVLWAFGGTGRRIATAGFVDVEEIRESDERSDAVSDGGGGS